MSPDHRTPPDSPPIYRATVKRLQGVVTHTQHTEAEGLATWSAAQAAAEKAWTAYAAAADAHANATWTLDAYRSTQAEAHAYARAKAKGITANAKRAYVARKTAN